MPVTLPSHPRAPARLATWLRSDMPIARWILLIPLPLLLTLACVALDEDPPRLLIILFTSLLGSVAIYYFGFGLPRPAARISRSRLFIPACICGLFLTVLAAGIYFSIGEATNSDLLRVPEFATQWVLLYGGWLFGDLSIMNHGPAGTLTNVLTALAEVMLLVIIATWLLIAFAGRRSASRFDLATRFSLIMLLASLLALAVILPAHVFVMSRGGFLAGIVTNPSLRGASLSLLFSWTSIVILIFLRPLHRSQSSSQAPWCRHCGYDLRASPNLCPECGQPVVSPN